MTTTTTKKHRAAEPLPAVQTDAGGAHRAHRTAETVITVTLGAILIVLAAYMTLRG
jgi:hypothetical protein